MDLHNVSSYKYFIVTTHADSNPAVKTAKFQFNVDRMTDYCLSNVKLSVLNRIITVAHRYRNIYDREVDPKPVSYTHLDVYKRQK